MNASDRDRDDGLSLPPARPADGPDRSRRVWSLALGAGLVGGLIAWAAGEAAIAAVKPETEMLSAMGVMMETVSRKGEIEANATKSHLSSGVLGGALGLCLGLGGGLARRSARQGAIAGAVGLVVGGAVGTAGSMALAPVYQAHRDAEPLSTDLTVPMLVHGGIWTLVGAAGGLAFGLGLGAGRGDLVAAVVGGLIGAALGTLAFEALGAAAFPLDKTHMPVSASGTSRLASRMTVALLAAAGIGAMLTREPSRRRRPEPGPSPAP
ncbi:hypothetical protein [Tautonia plasticadhaerens]|uniref:Uncharacterized protein n=1 Tax=Tautonia plasticadhaerens TaxID=2527974 RepID=A0A518H092_9BACT|nr:hypothetical protein [Tautonia plasticadhaerens]QDV34258.1 hypothetical protein ElP_21430 [Tautonia plasticadhaerens]